MENPEDFSFIQQVGKISDYDMFRTFNMGIGMILVIDAADTTEVIDHLQTLGEEAYVIGTVQKVLKTSYSRRSKYEDCCFCFWYRFKFSLRF